MKAAPSLDGWCRKCMEKGLDIYGDGAECHQEVYEVAG